MIHPAHFFVFCSGIVYSIFIHATLRTLQCWREPQRQPLEKKNKGKQIGDQTCLVHHDDCTPPVDDNNQC